jgi:hypothetical protein
MWCKNVLTNYLQLVVYSSCSSNNLDYDKWRAPVPTKNGNDNNLNISFSMFLLLPAQTIKKKFNEHCISHKFFTEMISFLNVRTLTPLKMLLHHIGNKQTSTMKTFMCSVNHTDNLGFILSLNLFIQFL